MQKLSKNALDAIDIMMLKELAKDGRMSIKRLAAKVNINEHAAKFKLDRMISNGIIKVSVIRAFQLAGVTIDVFIGFKVKHGYRMNNVASNLITHPAIQLVALATGPYDIVTFASFDRLQDLSSFLRIDIGNFTGIAKTETLINLEIIKHVLTYFTDGTELTLHNNVLHRDLRHVPQTDELDETIIRELAKDGRVRIKDLSQKLGISRTTATKRLKRLISEKVIAIIAITEPESLGYEVRARIGINVSPGSADIVARRLATLEGVHFVALTLGQYDILIGVHFMELVNLSDFIEGTLSKIPEITNMEKMIYLKVFKSPF